MELEHSANVEGLTKTCSHQDSMLMDEEGTQNTLGLHVDVPLFADFRMNLFPGKPCDARVQQSVQMARQDNSFSVFGDDKLGAIPSQNGKQEQSNFPTLEGSGSRFEDVYAEASTSIKLGEIKHFYMRRHKRLKQSSAPSEVSLQMSEQKPFIASKTPDEMPREQANGKDMCLDNPPSEVSLQMSGQKPFVASKTPREHANDKDVCLDNAQPELSLQMSEKEPFVASTTPDEMAPREQVNDKDVCPNNVSSSLDDEDLDLENKDPRTPTLDLSESALLQLKQANSQAKKAARWTRELMQLVGDGHSFNESTEMDNRDLSNTSRKRRRLQNNELENLVVKERTATQNAIVLVKEAQRKWRDVELSSTDPAELIGCKCKVFWPDDKVWYTGVINGYNSEAGIHHVHYDDGDKEDLILAKELIKFYLSDDDIIARKLVLQGEMDERKRLDFQEMAALATVFEDFQEEFRHGELVWAKIKGHPMWPAFVIDEKHADAWGLDAPVHENTLAVQFFGSYDYARINLKQAVAFSKGLLLKLYGKCKKATFDQGLKEAERYLKEGKLPDIMSKLQDDALDPTLNPSQMDMKEEDQDFMGDERTHKTKKSVQSLYTCPIKLGDLQVLSLGKIVRDSEFFHTENQIWTEGYTAVRKFTSIKDPGKCVDYTMEITKDPHDRTKPLFCVTSADGEVVEGSSPSMCWKKIYQKLDKAKEKSGSLGFQKRQASLGDSMFGFTNPQILKLIQALPYARVCFKFTGWFDKRATETSEQLLPAGFTPVEVDWKHADRCSVCDLDEDYTNNLFLQCDRCRILVHMHCYGESEPPNGHLWLCQLCSKGVSAQNALCCLCPVQGGAMKRTTDERWAHLTCAMWIPETCFVDVKHMEPIDGLKSINKERWKLTCSICKVPYGVCIQCSDPSCYIAYHVLCARSSGYVLEVSEDLSHKARDGVEDLEDSVRFLSYCKKHRQSKTERGTLTQRIASSKQELGYYPPINSSGCARTEPYDGATRRGRQEPEVRAAASAKRLYVEKLPYLVSGFCKQDRCGSDIIAHKFALYLSQARNMQSRKSSLGTGDTKALTTKGVEKETDVVAEDFSNICSVADRYQHMCESLKHRLTFGKSAIHGWGVFTKTSHRAGDMVIEYAGEVVRPIVADLRERSIYNTLVGAGTYMFRIDDERVVDATREGSIAHLINHSCEPNCFSRVVTVCGEEHIIIFAKRDIEKGEELSYDYRFTSKGEQLECFCGSPSCRGFVNVNDDEETSKILVPCREIMAWTPLAS